MTNADFDEIMANVRELIRYATAMAQIESFPPGHRNSVSKLFDEASETLIKSIRKHVVVKEPTNGRG